LQFRFALSARICAAVGPAMKGRQRRTFNTFSWRHMNIRHNIYCAQKQGLTRCRPIAGLNRIRSQPASRLHDDRFDPRRADPCVHFLTGPDPIDV
jgi:hypothetical protein